MKDFADKRTYIAGNQIDTGIREVVVDEICKCAKKYQVAQVILFGSRARGDYKKGSDIDLAFRLVEKWI